MRNSRKAISSAGRRNAYVFLTLVGVMTGTGALLLGLQPAPLAPDACRSLMAVDSASAELVFQTKIPVRRAHWKYIYVHHSHESAGSAAMLADTAGPANSTPDHFIIGNGDGCGDGEIQVAQRWNLQQPAVRPSGLDRLNPDCISICLIGDLDRAYPTPRQVEQLHALISMLRSRLTIGPEQILAVDVPNSAAGAGQYFPYDQFRRHPIP